MDYLLLQEATTNFDNLINQVSESHKPVMTSPRNEWVNTQKLGL